MANATDYGLFLSTTAIFDASRLQTVDVNSNEFKQMLVTLYQTVNNIVLALNKKETGIYDLNEFVTGSTLFPNPALTHASSITPAARQVFRKVISIGTLPNAAGTKTVAHGITFSSNTTFLKIFGAAYDPVGIVALPLPYTSTVGNDIEVWVDATNINVRVTSNRSAYTVVYVVLEYVKN
jgi:hypothetical protein